MEPDFLILKTKERLDKIETRIGDFLAIISGLSFWREHFVQKNFSYEREKFNWEYWEKIPFFTKEDFLKIGLSARVSDASIDIAKNPHSFILRMTSGTSGSMEPIVTLRPVSAIAFKKGIGRTVWAHDSYVMGLLSTLLYIDANLRTGDNKSQTFLLNFYRMRPTAANALGEFGADSISAFPAVLTRLASDMLENNIPAPASLQKVFMSGDFLLNAQKALIRRVFGDFSLEMHYGLGEFGKIGTACKFLTEKYGMNVYHPVKYHSIIEIRDMDENGYGEVVATSLDDPALCLIRYCTGDIGRVIREECECGANFTLLLAGRKNFDYIKCAGAMLVRQELERVLKLLSDYIDEWRAEAREKISGTRIVGELTIKIKPTQKYLSSADAADILCQKIQKNMFLTPTHTMEQLVSSGAFFPLKIELVENFPETKKPLLLKRIN